MRQLQLLVIDDDELIRESLVQTIPDPWSATTMASLNELPRTAFQAAMVDLHLTGRIDQAEGIELIRRLAKSYPLLEIIAISGNLDRDLMEQCLKAGASRFLAKPLNPEEVAITLQKIEALILLREASLRGSQRNPAWIGSGPASHQLLKRIAELKGERGPILIEGESGSGKEVVAHLLNQQEAERPIISINVAAIPENLFESELFGHVKGAFTGADQNKMGLAEAAAGGDLFLDEIEALPLSLQAKLLRFLETGELRRVGARESIQVSVRIIAASNRSLADMVQAGEFREDLLWRLSGQSLRLPSLRERKEDLKDLAHYWLGRDRVRRKTLSPEALEALQSYDWPGNVRELKRVCERLITQSPLPIVRGEDVARSLNLARPTLGGPGALGPVDFSKGLAKMVEEHEASLIRRCLELHSDIDESARILQISRSSLYKKIKDYDIPWGGGTA